MKIKDKLKELKPTDLNCNVFDVYSYNGLSIQDLLCQFFHKINECVNISNNTLDLCDWLVNEGLEKEVARKLVLMYEDGSLGEIINTTLLGNINEKVNNINSKVDNIQNIQYVNINKYNFNLDGVNDDSSQLQRAIDETIKNNGKLVFPSNSKIKLSQTIYLLNQGKFNGHCEIDFNNSEIIVDDDFIIFDSGRFEQNVYFSTYNDSLDNTMSFGFTFGNFKVKSSVTRNNFVVRIKDWHHGCKLHSIVDESNKFICSKNSYYCEFSNLRNIAYEGSNDTKFLFEGQHNLCNMNKLMGANCNIIYEFRGNCSGVDFNNNSLEGANIGILFSGYMWNFTIRDCYMENINQSVIKCTNNTGCKLSIHDNYFQFRHDDVNNYLMDMSKNELAKYEINFDSSNKILDMSSDRIYKGGSSISVNNIHLPNEVMPPPNPGNDDIYKLKKDEYVYGKNSNITQLVSNDNIKGKVVTGLIPGYYAGSFTTGYTVGIQGCNFPVMSEDNKIMTLWTAMSNKDTCLIYVNLQIITAKGTELIRGLFMGDTFIGNKSDYMNINLVAQTNTDNIKIEITDTREESYLGAWSKGEIRLI